MTGPKRLPWGLPTGKTMLGIVPRRCPSTSTTPRTALPEILAVQRFWRFLDDCGGH